MTTSRRILIVEDEKFTVKVLTQVLREQETEVQAAGSLKEAGEMLAKGPVDLVILDRILPDGDGVKLLLRMREVPAYAHIPVMILSGKDKEEDQVDGLDLGADDYITKPFSVVDVRARVNVLLRRAKKFRN